jgi:hypothetical protein
MPSAEPPIAPALIAAPTAALKAAMAAAAPLLRDPATGLFTESD